RLDSPRGRGAVGSAFEWHSKGRGFESLRLHFDSRVSAVDSRLFSLTKSAFSSMRPLAPACSPIPAKIEENDTRWVADGGVMAGEVEAACLTIQAEDRDIVTSLIATIEELTRGVKIE